MPLLIQQQIDNAAKLGVWRIEEPESFFLGRTGLQPEIRHPRKRLQHLAGRLLLQELEPRLSIRDIRIAAAGKPLSPDGPFHFSISHCGGYAAAIVSRDLTVGIDIEQVQPRILGLRQKFLSGDEESLLLAALPDPAAAFTFGWAVKESVYKWNGEGPVDFREHIRIDSVRAEGSQQIATCRFLKSGEKKLQAAGFSFDDHMLCRIMA